MRGFNRYSVLAVALSLAMLLTGVLAEAHPFHDRSGGAMMGHLLRGLDLTAQQKQQIKGIMQQHRGDLLAGKVAVLRARQNLMSVTTGSTFDTNAVQNAYGALATAQENMTVLQAQIFSQVMPVLTPDQQSKVKDKIAKINGRMQRTIDRLQSKLSSPSAGNQ